MFHSTSQPNLFDNTVTARQKYATGLFQSELTQQISTRLYFLCPSSLFWQYAM